MDPGRPWPSSIELVPASHPLPDEGSLRAGRAAIDLLRGRTASDLVLVLVSGGGSALLEAPREGISLGRLREITQVLQRAGAEITELNTLRRALSRLKGGGLARLARPARIATLLISDVAGDPIEAIASGPTAPSPVPFRGALAVLRRYALAGEFADLAEFLGAQDRGREAGDADGGRQEKEAGNDPGNEGAPAVHHAVLASNLSAIEAVRREAWARGFRAVVVTTRMQGEARDVGRLLGGMAAGVRRRRLPVAPPACLIFGGETVVTVRGEGSGGRNQETALGAAAALAGIERAAVFSFATDGVDGPTDAAGAVATGDTAERARESGLSIEDALARNDSYRLFHKLGDLWITGATGTNVNDVAVALVYP
jgi:glycerate-2-kinase